MTLIKKDSYYLFEVKNKQDFSSLLKYLDASQANFNIIINLLDWDNSNIEMYKSLVPFHFIWKRANKSFILVSNMKKKDNQELISINSFEEALDYFHMDELTRNI